MVMSEDANDDTPTQAATISEENTLDNEATYQITLSGDALAGGNTASVLVTIGGDTENGTNEDFTQAVVDAKEEE